MGCVLLAHTYFQSMDQPHHIGAWQAGTFRLPGSKSKEVFFSISQHAIVEQCDVKFELI